MGGSAEAGAGGACSGEGEAAAGGAGACAGGVVMTSQTVNEAVSDW